jgi:predicted metalloprotease
MKWRQTRRSANVEERRGGVPGGAPVVGGLGLLVVIVASLVMGVDPSQVLEMLPADPGAGGPVTVGTPLPGTQGDFVSQVLADTELTWGTIFREDLSASYVEPRLVIFSGAVQSACGRAGSSVGPFYCSQDQQVYLDLTFFQALEDRLGAPGDFAQAYVIAHEVGHHVQNQMGTLGQVNAARSQVSAAEANELSVRLELQADCFAGVWANRAQQMHLVLDESDLREGIGAAEAVGDDRLQQQAQGYVVPDSFTHGTSEQRAEWFLRGYKSGDVGACDTFGP